MKQKWIALAVLGAMLVQVAPISSMTAAALETTAISDITATDAVLLKYNKHDTYVEIPDFVQMKQTLCCRIPLTVCR